MLSAHLGRAVRTTGPMPVHQIIHSPLLRSSCQNRALSGRAAATKAARLVAIPAVSLNHERRQRGQGRWRFWAMSSQLYWKKTVQRCCPVSSSMSNSRRGCWFKLAKYAFLLAELTGASKSRSPSSSPMEKCCQYSLRNEGGRCATRCGNGETSSM